MLTKGSAVVTSRHLKLLHFSLPLGGRLQAIFLLSLVCCRSFFLQDTDRKATSSAMIGERRFHVPNYCSGKNVTFVSIVLGRAGRRLKLYPKLQTTLFGFAASSDR